MFAFPGFSLLFKMEIRILSGAKIWSSTFKLKFLFNLLIHRYVAATLERKTSFLLLHSL